MMLDKIAMILASDGQLHAEDPCLVGVSGGADSICLLHVLYSLGYHPIAIHVNHHLRPEADQEAKTVERFVRDLGVDFVACDVDVMRYGDTHSLSIEEAARELRYQCLFEQAEKTSARAVLVAHNADDQVETILMHLLRGTGLTGLRGMEYSSLPNPWSEHIPLVRPLLSTTRQEILAYLNDHHLGFITDPSNTDVSYLRNRVRHELLPYLENYNPRIRGNLVRMGRLNQEDYALIQHLVGEAWQAIFIKRGPGYQAFRLPGFKTASPPIQRYLLRKAIAYHLPSLRDIDFDAIQRGIIFLADRHAQGQIDLIAGLRLLKEGDTFWLATWQADLPGNEFPSIPIGTAIEVMIPSTCELDGNWVLRAEAEPDIEQVIVQSSSNTDPFQAWVDLDALELPLVARNLQSGERIQPLGMQGHSIKISDLMVNLKIPRRVRPTWPMVSSAGVIIWVPGCRQSQLGQVTPASRHIAHLSMHRASSA